MAVKFCCAISPVLYQMENGQKCVQTLTIRFRFPLGTMQALLLAEGRSQHSTALNADGRNLQKN